MLLFFFTQKLLRYSFQWQRGAIAIFLCHIYIAPPLYADNQSAMMQAMFAKAFGKKANAPSKSTADLRINNSSYNQQIEVYSNEQKEIDRADAAALLIILNNTLTEEFFKKIKKTLETHKKITFSQLSAMGIKTSYNTTNLSLDIEIKPELQKPRILTMRYQNSATLRESNRIQPSDFGGYINLYSILNTSTISSAPRLKLRLDGSLNIHGYVLESTANKDGEQWILGDTLLTYDRPDKLYRYQAGDISTLIKGFQDNYSLRGISLTKNFFMDSKLQIKPRANSTFTLSTQSEIEVYVNGKLAKRFQLDEGKYTLEDIGLLDGANNIAIKIKDAFGKITHKTTHEYYDTQLLKPELSTFSTSLGILEDTQEETSTPLTQQLIFSGYYQQGLYKDLTLGVDLQFSHDRTLIGTEVISANKAGRFKVNLGLSHRREGALGSGLSMTYHPNKKLFLTDTGLDQFISTMSFRGEYRSQYFDQLTTETETVSSANTSFIHAKLQSSLAFNVGKKWTASLSSGLYSDHHNTVEYFTTASLSKRFRHGIRWNFSTEHKSDDELRIQTQINIPLSKKLFSRKQDITLNYNSKSNRLTEVYNIHPLGALGSNSLGGALKSIHSDNEQQMNAELHYKTHHFETHINAQQNTTSQQLDIGLNSSLLCAGSSCTFSYPVSDSFALIKGPANQDKPIAIKNGYGKFHYADDSDSELPDNYSALITDKNSQAVVLLDAYKYQRISIDEGGLPFGYDPEKTEFEFIPRYHSSFTLIAGGKPGTVVTGKVIDKNKEGMGFKGGQWVSQEENGKIIAFFTNKIGHFHLPSVPSGRYKVELFDHPKMKEIMIDIPDKKGDIYTVDELTVIEN